MSEPFDHDPSIPHSAESKKPLEFDIGHATEAKIEGQPNQDTLLVKPRDGVYGVFDGVGGYGGGDLASHRAAELVAAAYHNRTHNLSPDPYLETEFLASLLDDVSQQVTNEMAEKGLDQAGTTAAIVKMIEIPHGERVAAIATVGDSRVYVYDRYGRLKFQSVDNSNIDDRPEERQHKKAWQDYLDTVTDISHLEADNARERFNERNVIEHALGAGMVPHVKVEQVPVTEGDTIVLTSDGVHDNLTAEEIATIANGSGSGMDIAKSLVSQAKARANVQHLRSKFDDTTAIAIRVSPPKSELIAMPTWLAGADHDTLDESTRPKPKAEATAYEPQPITADTLPPGREVSYIADALKYPFELKLADWRLEVHKETDPEGKNELWLVEPGREPIDYVKGLGVRRIKEGEEIVIGRREPESSRVYTMNNGVSRVHVRVKYEDGRIHLEDNNSTNHSSVAPIERPTS